MKTIQLSEERPASSRLSIPFTLEAPETQVKIASTHAHLGRAQAILGTRRWDAKHYFRDDEGTVYEFDEALPAGPVVLEVPIES